jgi:putative FmdB family regulatory protein
MPIYEYQCTECGKKIEVLQRMDDAPPAACAACGGPLKKLISSPSFQFKGSGWYATDYAKKSGTAGDSGAGAAAGGSDSAGDGGSVSKPDAGEGGKSEAKRDAGGSSDSKSGSAAASGASTSSTDRSKGSDSGAKPKAASPGSDR